MAATWWNDLCFISLIKKIYIFILLFGASGGRIVLNFWSTSAVWYSITISSPCPQHAHIYNHHHLRTHSIVYPNIYHTSDSWLTLDFLIIPQASSWGPSFLTDMPIKLTVLTLTGNRLKCSIIFVPSVKRKELHFSNSQKWSKEDTVVTHWQHHEWARLNDAHGRRTL